jgi:hypothetical protein
VLISSALDKERASSLFEYLRTLVSLGFVGSDPQVPDTPAGYKNPVIEKILTNLAPAVEEWAGCRVFPTYSYFRLYKHGDILRRHRDREACEISLSVCLGFSGNEPWPLFIEGTDGVFAATMRPGDGLLYKGTECAHWRESFTGMVAAQVFFHYVNQEGPYKEYRNDKRVLKGESLAG